MAKLALLMPAVDNATYTAELDLQIGMFAQLGIAHDRFRWDAPQLYLDHDLVLPLMAWGYHAAPAAWEEVLGVCEAAGVVMLNPVATLRWNGDKAYLLDLAARGVAVVPTRASIALTLADLDAARAAFATEDLVIKPPVSAGADGTYALRNGAPAPPLALGRATLIQPMMPAISDEGEYSLFLFGGEFSHAILKTPCRGDFRVQAQFGGVARPVIAPAAALAAAQAALAQVPGPLLYARVDLVADGAGGFALMELELIEPFLFLQHAPDGGAGFAKALAAALNRRGQAPG